MEVNEPGLWEWRWHAGLIAAAIVLCILFMDYPPESSHEITQQPVTEFPLSFSLRQDALTAQAAIVYDPQTGKILFAKNATLALPLASLTKLMAAEVVLARENPRDAVIITSEHTASINDHGDLGLRAGQLWSVGELVRYGLFASSNNAMLAAAAASTRAESTSTVNAMNERARDMGLTTANFYNPTGLDINEELSGGYGSAKDMAIIAATFYNGHPSFFETTMRSDTTFGPEGEWAEPTAAPIQDIPGLLAAKTGYTDLAHGNLVAIFDAEIGHPLVVVVLSSTKEGRFKDVRMLIAAARAAK